MTKFEPEVDPEPLPWAWTALTVIAMAAIVWLAIEIAELIQDVGRWAQ